MDDISHQANILEHEIKQKYPKVPIMKLYENSFIVAHSDRKESVSPIVALDKVIQTHTIFLKDILLVLLTEASYSDE